jgi:hypothetical protein
LVDVKNFNFNYDKKYLKEFNVNRTVDSDGVSHFNILADTRYVITKLMGFLRVRIPAEKNDKDFKKEFLKLAVDVEKLLSGQANVLMKMIGKMVLDACDRKVEFPLAKVSSTVFASIANFFAHRASIGIQMSHSMTTSFRISTITSNLKFFGISESLVVSEVERKPSGSEMEAEQSNFGRKIARRSSTSPTQSTMKWSEWQQDIS